MTIRHRLTVPHSVATLPPGTNPSTSCLSRLTQWRRNGHEWQATAPMRSRRMLQMPRLSHTCGSCQAGKPDVLEVSQEARVTIRRRLTVPHSVATLSLGTSPSTSSLSGRLTQWRENDATSARKQCPIAYVGCFKCRGSHTCGSCQAGKPDVLEVSSETRVTIRHRLTVPHSVATLPPAARTQVRQPFQADFNGEKRPRVASNAPCGVYGCFKCRGSHTCGSCQAGKPDVLEVSQNPA